MATPRKKPEDLIVHVPKQPPADAAERIRALAADGWSIRGIATHLGTSQDTLRDRWFVEQPALREAMDDGRELERHTLHNVLYRAATSGNDKGALIAAMFLLKSRHSYREGADPVEQASRLNIVFNMPAALPMADYVEVSNADGTEVQRVSTTVARTPRRS